MAKIEPWYLKAITGILEKNSVLLFIKVFELEHFNKEAELLTFLSSVLNG